MGQLYPINQVGDSPILLAPSTQLVAWAGQATASVAPMTTEFSGS